MPTYGLSEIAVINVTLTGSTDRVTSTATYARWFAVQLSNGATGTVVYTGPSSMTGATNCWFEANKGVPQSVTQAMFKDTMGNYYDLSAVYLNGTLGDVVHVVYEPATLV